MNGKKVALRSILESSNGIHLTAYLVNSGDVEDLKRQIGETVGEAYEWLHDVQSSDERNKFLAPIDGLLKDARVLKDIKGNVGLFRTKNSFRILSLPIELERQCHVADSFHVKPLLRWMQSDRDFLLVGLGDDACHLYCGNRASLKKIDSFIYPRFSKAETNSIAAKGEIASWLDDWIVEFSQNSKPKLFLAAESSIANSFSKCLNLRSLTKIPLSKSFSESQLDQISTKIEHALEREADQLVSRSILEFLYADDLKSTQKNIFQIAQLAVRGRIKKLIVAEDVNIFGKMDKKTGGLEINPFDSDHEDDDILDDLAQTVLAAGGEVVVAPKDELPERRLAVAILDRGGHELQKTETKPVLTRKRERMSV